MAKHLSRQYKYMREIEQTEKYTIIRYDNPYDYYKRYESSVYSGTYSNCIALYAYVKNDKDELKAHILLIDKNGNIKDTVPYDEYRESLSDFAEGQKIDLNKGVSKTENINLVFFHREGYHRRKWGIFPGSDTERRNPHWSGTGFFDISLNMETLKVKIRMNKNQKSIFGHNINPYITASSPFELFVFDNFDFYLLKDSYSVFLIKPKP
jgi:hypothetical protein